MQTGLHIFILPRDPHLFSDCMIGIATLRQVWSWGRRIYLTLTYSLPISASQEAHWQSFLAPGKPCMCYSDYVQGILTGKLKLHLSTSSCLYLDQVYLYLWVGCGPFLSQLYARYCNNNLFKSQNKKSIRVNKITSTFICLITKS